MLFSGDQVLGWGTTFQQDLHQYMATLHRMIAATPTRLFPGHGPPIEDSLGFLARYIAHRQAREDQLWQRLSDPDVHRGVAATMDLVRGLYADIDEQRLWMARENVEKILRKFEKETRVFAWVVVTDEDDEDGGEDDERGVALDKQPGGVTTLGAINPPSAQLDDTGGSGSVVVWRGGVEQPQGGVGVSTAANKWRRHIFPPGFVRRQPSYLVWTAYPHPPPNDWSANRPGFDFDDVGPGSRD